MSEYVIADKKKLSGSYILTFSGRYVDPLDLQETDVSLTDIAHALSNLCRFTGHVSSFYSVAQHSVLVSKVLDGTGLEMWGLLHDANEAYLNDTARPLKTDPYFGQAIRGANKRAAKVIADRYDLGWPEPDEVKAADRRLLATERRDLMARTGDWELLKGVDPLEKVIIPWLPKKAEKEFLKRYNELKEKTQ